VQALILAGGEGTRLRPLTSTQPKPVVPLAGRPLISYMLEWLRGHGVEDVLLSCGFLAGGVRAVLGDGSEYGVRLRYLEEPEPLGTGGALKFAEELLEERFLMLNGDVLTDIDLTAELAQHERTGARATLALVPVEDPSAYGLVRRASDAAVTEFVEKPRPNEIDTNLINAGAYILERDILAEMPAAGSNVSIEREVFPSLVGRGLFGFQASAYWLDIGTPDRYLQGTFDILEGRVATTVGRRLEAAGGVLSDAGGVDGQLVAPALVGSGSVIAEGAVVGGCAVLGRDVEIGEGASVERSVLLDGASVGPHSEIRSAILGPGAHVGERCQIEGDAVLGEGARVRPGHTLELGARIFPGVQVPQGATKS
jgi:mannose-1-phosphate guanylyltransferase